MKLTKVTPVAAALKGDIDRLFERVLGPGFPAMFGPALVPPFPAVEYEGTLVPALDVIETDKEFKLMLEVPGIPKENLDIRLDGQLLRITGHREFAKEITEAGYLIREREAGRFVRTINLPVPVKETAIEAVVENGVLTLVLPKAAPAAAAKITIK